jgi:hypothetical protein
MHQGFEKGGRITCTPYPSIYTYIPLDQSNKTNPRSCVKSVVKLIHIKLSPLSFIQLISPLLINKGEVALGNSRAGHVWEWKERRKIGLND